MEGRWLVFGLLVAMLLRDAPRSVGPWLKMESEELEGGISLDRFLESPEIRRQPLLMEELILREDSTDGGRLPRRCDGSREESRDIACGARLCSILPGRLEYDLYGCLSLESQDVGGVDCEA